MSRLITSTWRCARALAVALQEFSGAMVIVSHDRHLLRVTTDSLLLVNDGAVSEFRDALDDYPKWLSDRNRHVRTESDARSGRNRKDRKQQKRLEAEYRQKLAPLRKAVKQTEQALEALGRDQKILDEKLAEPALYEEGGGEVLKGLLSQQADLKKRLSEAEAKCWKPAIDSRNSSIQPERTSRGVI